ncbi:MAG: SDR family oxidoreductase [Rhizobiaceae bacterium]|nr:SDR family oxidoreductase [Rhizobiaceae bacterium]
MSQRRIVLTGADGTVGSGVQTRLSASGWTVTTIGHRAGLADLLADFRSEDSLRSAMSAVGGALDGMVFAHGMLEPGPVDRVTPAAWRQMMAVNLDSIYTMIHYALPQLRPGASIVVVSSTAAFDHSPVGGPHYTAGKWALNGLVRHLAFDLGPRGIRINSVCPGTVEGPMARALLSEADYMESLKGIPLGRAAEASEIAEVVAFLLDAKSGYVTGANLPVSGGYR